MRGVRAFRFLAFFSGFFLLPSLVSYAGASGSEVPIRKGRYQSAILMNADTGEVLYAYKPHRKHPPASMVKMMLMLLVMEKVESHSVTLADPVKTSALASHYGGSQVYLKEGEVFPLEELMKAIVIHSANDATVAVAQYLTGSLEGCVDLMNRKARELGMKDTVYHSVEGLPPGRGELPDLSTAYDLALLGRALIRYPKIREWCSIQRAPFRGGKFILTNTNRLIGTFPGADGIKTGYYRKAGYNLTATASRDGLRILSVVLGAPKDEDRFRESARLLSIGFNLYKKVRAVRKGEILSPEVPVSGAGVRSTALIAAHDVFVHVRRGRESAVHTVLSVPDVLEAPVEKGRSYGSVLVKNGDRELGRTDAVAASEIPEAPLCKRLIDRFF